MFITTSQVAMELVSNLNVGTTAGAVMLMSGAVPNKVQQDELVDTSVIPAGIFTYAKIKTWVETAGKGGGKIIAQYDYGSEVTIELKYNQFNLGLSKAANKGTGLITPTPTPTWAIILFNFYTGTTAAQSIQAYNAVIATIGIGEASSADLKIAGAVALGQDFKLGDLKFNIDTLSI